MTNREKLNQFSNLDFASCLVHYDIPCLMCNYLCTPMCEKENKYNCVEGVIRWLESGE